MNTLRQIPQIRRLLPALGPLSIIRTWSGVEGYVSDGLPVIGRLPGTGNVFVSSGHGMLGVTLAAGSARALTELVVRGVAPAQLAPFDPARFAARIRTARIGTARFPVPLPFQPTAQSRRTRS